MNKDSKSGLGISFDVIAMVVVVLVIGSIVVMGTVAYNRYGEDSPKDKALFKKADEAAKYLETHTTLTYKVTGTASEVDVTYGIGSKISQDNGYDVPWVRSWPSINRGEYYSISAQNKGEDGNVSVSVYEDGKLIDSTTSNGGYAIASVSGSLP